MQSTIYFTLGLFSAYAVAQSATSSEIANGIESIGASVIADPGVSSVIASIESALPTPIGSAVKSATPAIESDVVAYLASLVDTPKFTSVNNALGSVLPSDVLAQLSTAPADFYIALVTETAAPTWASAIPTSVAEYLDSVNARIKSIEYADVYKELPSITVVGGARPTGYGYPAGPGGNNGYGYPAGTGGFATGYYPTGAGSNNGSSTTGTTIPSSFVGAASRNSGTLAIAILVVASTSWFLC